MKTAFPVGAGAASAVPVPISPSANASTTTRAVRPCFIVSPSRAGASGPGTTLTAHLRRTAVSGENRGQLPAQRVDGDGAGEQVRHVAGGAVGGAGDARRGAVDGRVVGDQP